MNTCECCGRTGLKRTVALDIDGGTVYYGTQCAARVLGLSGRFTNPTAVVKFATARKEVAEKRAAAREKAQAEANATGEDVAFYFYRSGQAVTFGAMEADRFLRLNRYNLIDWIAPE